MVCGKAQTVMEPYIAKYGDEIKDMNASEKDAGNEHKLSEYFQILQYCLQQNSKNQYTFYVHYLHLSQMHSYL